MKKIALMAILSSIFFTSCEKSGFFAETPLDPTYFGFLTSELIIEVTPDTKSFRIEVEATPKSSEYTSVRIDPIKTSAKHNFHFINTVDVMADNSLGKFTPILGTKKSYRDVSIIPENIKDRVVITYTTGDYFIDENEPENLIKELTVILQPKSDE